jgi:aminopeptidase YwaD
MKRSAITLVALVLLISGTAGAQYTPWLYWTFLPQAQMDEIVGEASGEAAWRTISVLNSFNRQRTPEEFKTNFFETRFVRDQLVKFGLGKPEIVTFPAGEGWVAIKGDLWEVKPIHQMLASYNDNVPMLAYGSSPTDATGELVWVGRGTPEDIKSANVQGKVVVTEGNMGPVHAEACQRQGALGVITIGAGRLGADEFEIPWNSIGLRAFPPFPGQPTPPAPKQAVAPPAPKFGFSLPGREGDLLKRRLMRGEKITVRARIESETLPYNMENVVALIPGTDPNGGEIIFSAHLFEGIVKQGANDDISGCAAILEVARVLRTLIDDGRLPKPRRSIRFLWGPEIAGTGRWVQANQPIMEKTLCNINLDMVGEWLTKCHAFMCLMRTTYGNAHYINDVMENYYRYVGEGNRERIQNRSASYPVPRRIVGPFGAAQPVD